MNVSETYGINIINGAQNNKYSNTVFGQIPTKSSYYPEHPSLIHTTSKDTFNPKISPLNKGKTQKAISQTQDKIYTRLFPEKFILKYANHNFLSNAIKNNPQIATLLQKEGLKINIEPQNVTKIIHSHLIPTMHYSREIMRNSGEYFSAQDYEHMCQAALIHDIGKALIPNTILNKPTTLTPKEREIVKLHNDIGYEILKSTNLSPKVLSMVQNHHGYGQIYPKDSLTQILTIADIYSALKEKRAYKKALTDKEAFEILSQGVNAGDFNIHYVKSLKKAIQNNISPQLISV